MKDFIKKMFFVILLSSAFVTTAQNTYTYQIIDAANNTVALSSFSGDLTWNLYDASSINVVSNVASGVHTRAEFVTVENTRIENGHPYAYYGDLNGAYGDQGDVDYYGWSPTVGTLFFTVNYYNGATLTTTDTFTITFVNNPPSGGVTGTTVRINAGGPALIHGGEQFDVDQYFVGGLPYLQASAVVPELYQTERSGSARTFDYSIPVVNGDYDVILHFAEIYWGATGGGTGGPNKRVFDVSIEGSTVLNNYDLYAEVGGETVSIKNFPVTISDGELNLNFSGLPAVGGVDQAKVSAIEVIPAGSGGGGSGEGGLWTSSGANDIYYSTGNVGINTTPLSAYKLAVDGNIRSREVKVDNDNWADYVFLEDYQLPTLQEVEQHIKEKGHLINIPSAAEVEANGIELGEMNKLLLEKIEELTLYVIELDKEIVQLKILKK